jgi:hypothetical protein
LQSSSQELRAQTPDDVRDNIVKIVDKDGEFYGSGFFIEINNVKYCISWRDLASILLNGSRNILT